MAISFQSVKTLFGLLKLAPAIQKGLRRWKGRPTVAERALLAEWARRLDERRVFFVDYNIEVVEACLASLEHVRDFTDETLGKVKHAGARAMLGAILDVVRQFNDNWHGFQTPGPNHVSRHRGDREDSRSLAHFFEDLGELRAKVRLLVGALADIEPEVKAPNLLDRDDERRDQEA